MANEVGVVYVSIMPTTDGFTRAVNRDITGPLDSAAGKGEKSFGRMFRRVAAVAGGVLAAIGLGKLVKETISLGVEYNTLEQTSRAAFTTILGSADAAADMMSNLREFAKTSPFPRQAYISAAQQMAAFGINSKKVIPYLDAITDAVAAAGGSGQELSEIAFVMSQISAAGKITGQDLIQFGQRGINAAELIGSQMGKTGAEIKAEITKGTLGADEALDALAAGMAKKFDGAAENVKNTWLGSVDRIKGAWRDISSILVAPFIDPEGGGYAVEWANIVADSLRALESSPGLAGFQTKLRDIAKSMDPFIKATGEAFKLLGEENGWTKFVDAMSEVSPLFGFIATIAESLEPVLPALSEALVEVARALLSEGVMDALVKLIVEVLPPLADLLVAIAPLIPPIAQALTSLLVPALSGTSTALSDAKTFFEGLAAFLSGDMSLEDWVKTVMTLPGSIGPIFREIGGLVLGTLNVFIDAANSYTKALEGAINGVRSLLGLGAMPGLPKIPRYNLDRIPGLADSGTVLPRPGGTLILAAEAGRAESVVDTGKLNQLMDAARNGGGGSSDRPIYMDGNLFGILRQMANGEARIVLNDSISRAYAAGR